MNLTLSVPGKTFLAGEYLALIGGPALVLATKPQFQLQVKALPAEISARNPFHPNSPAGLFYQKHAAFFEKWDLQFSDPYEGVGGFGASSAQFVLLHGLLQLMATANFESQPDLDWHRMLHDYRAIHQGPGMPPSGADVIGQAVGGISFFERRTGQIQYFSWPFEKEILLFHTGFKISTHEHLQEIDQNTNSIPDAAMTAAVLSMKEALQTLNLQAWVSGLNEFSSILENQEWILSRTHELVRELKIHPGVITAKGCGALGADVVMALIEPQERSSVIELANRLGLRFVSSSANISPGFQFKTGPSESAFEGANL